jgi:HPt (histidine-containing phosphotransfer) domain-containing protein
MSRAFDEQELLERVDQDWDFLSDTVQMLATDGRLNMEQIRSAIAAGNAAEVGRVAHALKGMISNFCSPTTQSSAFDMEKLGKGGDLSGAPAVLTQLDERLETLIADLLDFVAKRS